MKNADTYRDAMRVIHECNQDQDAKAFAFGKASESHAKGDMAEATRWVEIASAVDVLLQDIPSPEFVPTCLN